jgi:hypothetical protein
MIVHMPQQIALCSTTLQSNQCWTCFICAGQLGIGIGSNARQAFWAPCRRTYSGSLVRGDQANDTPRSSTRNERPSADIVSTSRLIRPSGPLTISGAAKDGERVCFVAARALPISPYAPSHRDHRLHPWLSRTSISAYPSFLRLAQRDLNSVATGTQS